jgi:spermidine synthase
MNSKSFNILYETISDISGRIRVTEEKGIRGLFVDGVKQSIWSDNQDDFLKTYWFASSQLPIDDPEKPLNILMCGLGGGTIIKLLRQQYKNIEFTILELDPEIIKIASEFFDLKSDENTKIIQTDANDWIEKNSQEYKNKFDVIYLDAYIADIFKIKYSEKKDQMKTLCSMLNADGIFVTNHIIYSDDFQKEISEHTNYISNYFSEIYTNIISKYSEADNVVIKGVYPIL